MFVAMNRFRIVPGQEAAFEALWTGRKSHLHETPGFVSFHLLKGGAAADHVPYCSHSVWESRASFEAWTRSEAFRAAHGGIGSSKELYLEAPVLELFEAVEGA
ncbi:MAG: antibiotic biosynthesis monooxygenase [Pseudomonadota bacterium]